MTTTPESRNSSCSRGVPLTVGERTAEAGASIAIDAADLITASGGLIDAKRTYLDWAAALEQVGL